MLWEGIQNSCILGVNNASFAESMRKYTFFGQHLVQQEIPFAIPTNKDIFYVEYGNSILPGGNNPTRYGHSIESITYGDINCGPAAN